MVWIKGAVDEYINLDKICMIYVPKDTPPYNIYAVFEDGVRRPIFVGFKEIEEAQAVLDELMKKIK